MPLPLLSGKQIIKILVKEFGFAMSRQKGSHISLYKFVGGHKIVTVVPDHRQVQRGTLRSALRLARVTEEEFEVAAKN
ncbi:MAG: type II toxin-antitoxin system HicA family toxin [Candidatus Berkelbacteria bacterium]|nr:type II toxin-antitoxin system HicA family toxin [Candidatus Berkelbacteria bacterium]MCR4307380.1 type II toxin-antitoxin system HicA family toxin [Candidatus Berkelbacteria bacterium]